MNSKQIDRWLSISANFGVLVGVFFLIFEINQNTRAIETEVIWSRGEQQTELALAIIENPDVAELHQTFNEMSAEELDQVRTSNPVDYYRFAQYWMAHRIFYESRFLTQTSELERNVLRDNIAFNLSTRPGARYTVSRINGGDNSRGTEFQRFINEIISSLE